MKIDRLIAITMYLLNREIVSSSVMKPVKLRGVSPYIY